MARKKKDLDVNIDTKNVDVKVKRKAGKTDISIDTELIDAEIHKTDEGVAVDIKTDGTFDRIIQGVKVLIRRIG